MASAQHGQGVSGVFEPAGCPGGAGLRHGCRTAGGRHGYFQLPLLQRAHRDLGVLVGVQDDVGDPQALGRVALYCSGGSQVPVRQACFASGQWVYASAVAWTRRRVQRPSTGVSASRARSSICRLTSATSMCASPAGQRCAVRRLVRTVEGGRQSGQGLPLMRVPARYASTAARMWERGGWHIVTSKGRGVVEGVRGRGGGHLGVLGEAASVRLTGAPRAARRQRQRPAHQLRQEPGHVTHTDRAAGGFPAAGHIDEPHLRLANGHLRCGT